MQSGLLLLSLAPFILFVLLLFWKKASLLLISSLALLLTLILVVFYWQILPNYLVASIAKGLLSALDIFIIIFGAIFFLEILKAGKIINNLCLYLASLSRDYRVQIILLAWFVANFIEGTAGFGTPAAVVGPLLVALGLSPLTAVIVALLGNSTAGAFGAAGTPIRVGFAGLDISAVPLNAALINLVGFIVPVFMLYVITRKRQESRIEFVEAIPFALWSGLVFTLSSLATVFLGQEFPSILGAVIGILIVFITIKLKLFIPRKIRTLDEREVEQPSLPLAKVILPYALLIGFLILGKLILGSAGLRLNLGVIHTFNFYNPGFAFILAGLPIAFLISQKKGLVGNSALVATRRTLEPFLVIAVMSILVQLMTNSGENLSGLPSSLSYLAANLKTSLLPLITPFIGAFGSFVTGSVTVSNVMFGKLLSSAAQNVSQNVGWILALQLVGAAAGNMIAVADVLSAEAVVGLRNRTREVLLGVAIPCLIYVSIVGIIGLILLP